MLHVQRIDRGIFSARAARAEDLPIIDSFIQLILHYKRVPIIEHSRTIGYTKNSFKTGGRCVHVRQIKTKQGATGAAKTKQGATGGD